AAQAGHQPAVHAHHVVAPLPVHGEAAVLLEVPADEVGADRAGAVIGAGAQRHGRDARRLEPLDGLADHRRGLLVLLLAGGPERLLLDRERLSAVPHPVLLLALGSHAAIVPGRRWRHGAEAEGVPCRRREEAVEAPGPGACGLRASRWAAACPAPGAALSAPGRRRSTARRSRRRTPRR